MNKQGSNHNNKQITSATKSTDKDDGVVIHVWGW